MRKPLIYISRKIPSDVLEPYQNQFQFRMWQKEDPVPRSTLLQEIEEAEGLFCTLTEKIDRELLQKATNLKVVANMAVGFDNINVELAKEHGVIVTNTPDVLTETTADLGFALLMATARRVVEANNFIKNNRWDNWAPFLLAGSDIHHKTIGIVGMGRIGEAVAKRAKGFDMPILYHNRTRKLEAEKKLGATYVSFDDLLEKSDFVVSVVPLTEETNQLFNEAAFQKMKDSAIFVNISRGRTVDEEALIHALETKQLKAAGLDVFVNEPIKGEHPLMKLDNVVCLPHIGSASMETRTKMIELCLENISGVLLGTGPKTPIN
ncbi:2-hydroxyacid dehydrogenase [Oceanobacillus senegalensis]|uniref:2-hydroxyacid dehydrogenase n=1 Tax=Oceanobacillus senegalensis TaxID=1936063 RepID=UPI000A306ECA|nr:D-glycerate dehydrogenase [Oceanobacillus senegalensis]